MIFVDTNFFLRYMTQPTDPASTEMTRSAIELFRRVNSGDVTVTTSEVVLHELCYVLMSKKQYGYAVETVVDLVRAVISLKGFRFEAADKAVFLRALDILGEHPKLEFADAVIAARVERLDIPLATFDERLGKLPSITRWTT